MDSLSASWEFRGKLMFNDPERWTQERGYIERLMVRYGRRLDWDRIEELYEVFGLAEEAKELRKRFIHAQ